MSVGQIAMLACATWVLAAPSAGAGSEPVGNVLQERISALVARMRTRDVGAVEVLCMHPSTVTMIAITPETLERNFHYKLVVRLPIRENPLGPSLRRALADLTVKPANGQADLRMGVVLLGLDESRVGAVYLDANGKHGSVGTDDADFGTSLREWIKATLPFCFK